VGGIVAAGGKLVGEGSGKVGLGRGGTTVGEGSSVGGIVGIAGRGVTVGETVARAEQATMKVNNTIKYQKINLPVFIQTSFFKYI
jgi:hypothetical protein